MVDTLGTLRRGGGGDGDLESKASSTTSSIPSQESFFFLPNFIV